MRRPSIPIRIKIMIALLTVTTAVVSVITFTMANLFQQDKRAYINDLAAIVALNTAEESRALLAGYRDRLEACALVIDRPDITPEERSEFLDRFFRDFPALLGTAFYADGREVTAAYDAAAFRAAGLSRQDVQRRRREVPLPLERIGAGEVYVENSTLSPRLPSLTLAVAHRIEGRSRPAIVTGIVRLDGLPLRRVRCLHRRSLGDAPVPSRPATREPARSGGATAGGRGGALRAQRGNHPGVRRGRDGDDRRVRERRRR